MAWMKNFGESAHSSHEEDFVFEQFSRDMGMGSLSRKTLENPMHGPSELPNRTPRTSLRSKIRHQASRRVVSLGWWLSGTDQYMKQLHHISHDMLWSWTSRAETCNLLEWALRNCWRGRLNRGSDRRLDPEFWMWQCASRLLRLSKWISMGISCLPLCGCCLQKKRAQSFLRRAHMLACVCCRRRYFCIHVYLGGHTFAHVRARVHTCVRRFWSNVCSGQIENFSQIWYNNIVFFQILMFFINVSCVLSFRHDFLLSVFYMCFFVFYFSNVRNTWDYCWEILYKMFFFPEKRLRVSCWILNLNFMEEKQQISNNKLHLQILSSFRSWVAM